MSQELRQGRQQCPQCHYDPAAANQARPVGLGAKVADKQDESQVANFETAGNDANIGTLEVEASLQGGQNAHLAERQRQCYCYEGLSPLPTVADILMQVSTRDVK